MSRSTGRSFVSFRALCSCTGYRYDRAAGLLRRVADRTTAVPGQAGGARFTLMDGFVGTNVTGKIWFRASYSSGLGSQGLYRGDGLASLEVLVDGSGAYAVPGNPRSTFQTFGFPVANRINQTVFSATYGPAADDAGLFLRQSSGVIHKIVDFDDPVPGQPGAHLFAVGAVSVDGHGHAAFAARYSGGVGDEGIYFYNGQGLFLVADETTDFGGATATNLHLLTTTGSSGGEDGRPRALQDGDAIVFRAELSDGDEIVVLATRRP